MPEICPELFERLTDSIWSLSSREESMVPLQLNVIYDKFSKPNDLIVSAFMVGVAFQHPRISERALSWLHYLRTKFYLESQFHRSTAQSEGTCDGSVPSLLVVNEVSEPVIQEIMDVLLGNQICAILDFGGQPENPYGSILCGNFCSPYMTPSLRMILRELYQTVKGLS